MSIRPNFQHYWAAVPDLQWVVWTSQQRVSRRGSAGTAFSLQPQQISRVELTKKISPSKRNTWWTYDSVLWIKNRDRMSPPHKDLGRRPNNSSELRVTFFSIPSKAAWLCCWSIRARSHPDAYFGRNLRHVRIVHFGA